MSTIRVVTELPMLPWTADRRLEGFLPLLQQEEVERHALTEGGLLLCSLAGLYVQLAEEEAAFLPFLDGHSDLSEIALAAAAAGCSLSPRRLVQLGGWCSMRPAAEAAAS
ncbi:MAG: hypothetical protein FJ125_12775, partial [Deltaproteobacteria bacterium]|nr:hypothetical protein [Deltaproteobacteria bacterium]